MSLEPSPAWAAALTLLIVAGCGSTSDPPSTSSTAAGGTAGSGGFGGEGGSGGIPGSGGMAGAGGTVGAGGGGGAPPGGTCAIGRDPGGAGTTRVRVVAANLSSGNGQSYDLGHGVRILQGLDADVVLLQEMNFGNDSENDITSLVDDICDGGCNYVRGPQEKIPNGVLSRLPILECGSWADPEVANRNFVWARIDVPGDDDLWAISVHFLSSGASKRNLEAMALLDYMSAEIPSNDYVVLGGDLNTDSRTESAINTLDATFAIAAPHPVDHMGNGMTNQPRSRPYDWVLANDALFARQSAVTIESSTFVNGAVIDTRVYTPLDEIAPAELGDSGAPSMQHMAVIKDFRFDP